MILTRSLTRLKKRLRESFRVLIKKMPPKAAADEKPTKVAVSADEWLDTNKKIRELEFKRAAQRTKAQLKGATVPPPQPPKDPRKKIIERLKTYHNVRRMRTDYKNYVRLHGELTDVSVPSEISSIFFKGNTK